MCQDQGATARRVALQPGSCSTARCASAKHPSNTQCAHKLGHCRARQRAEQVAARACALLPAPQQYPVGQHGDLQCSTKSARAARCTCSAGTHRTPGMRTQLRVPPHLFYLDSGLNARRVAPTGRRASIHFLRRPSVQAPSSRGLPPMRHRRVLGRKRHKPSRRDGQELVAKNMGVTNRTLEHGTWELKFHGVVKPQAEIRIDESPQE